MGWRWNLSRPAALRRRSGDSPIYPRLRRPATSARLQVLPLSPGLQAGGKINSDPKSLRQIMNNNPRRFLAFVPKVKRKV